MSLNYEQTTRLKYGRHRRRGRPLHSAGIEVQQLRRLGRHQPADKTSRGEKNTTNFVLGEIALSGVVLPEKLYHPCRMNRGHALPSGKGGTATQGEQRPTALFYRGRNSQRS